MTNHTELDRLRDDLKNLEERRKNYIEARDRENEHVLRLQESLESQLKVVDNLEDDILHIQDRINDLTERKLKLDRDQVPPISVDEVEEVFNKAIGLLEAARYPDRANRRISDEAISRVKHFVRQIAIHGLVTYHPRRGC